MLIRIITKVDVWDLDSVDDLYNTEFCDDAGMPQPSISVFEVRDKNEALQVVTERRASLGKPSPVVAFDVDGLGDSHYSVTVTKGKDLLFSTATNLHRSLVFHGGLPGSSRAAAEVMFAAFDKKSARYYEFTKKDLKVYAKECVARNDPEWCDFRVNGYYAPGWKLGGP